MASTRVRGVGAVSLAARIQHAAAALQTCIAREEREDVGVGGPSGRRAFGERPVRERGAWCCRDQRRREAGR